MSSSTSHPSPLSGFRLCWLIVILIGASAVLAAMWVATRLQAADVRSEDLSTELRLAQLALANERQHREAENILARHAAASPICAYRVVPLTYEGTAPPPPLVLLWDMAQRRAILCGGPLGGSVTGPAQWEIALGGQSLMAGTLKIDAETNTFCTTATAATEVRPGESIVLQLATPDNTGTPLRWHGRLPSAAR